MDKQATSPQLLDENLRQWAEAQSADNRYFAGQALGHEPSPVEAFIHYTRYGGAQAFRERQRAVSSQTA